MQYAPPHRGGSEQRNRRLRRKRSLSLPDGPGVVALLVPGSAQQVEASRVLVAGWLVKDGSKETSDGFVLTRAAQGAIAVSREDCPYRYRRMSARLHQFPAVRVELIRRWRARVGRTDTVVSCPVACPSATVVQRRPSRLISTL